jgi:NTP pyrophosphatase (non-canonical NTP hydrolase)
VLVVFRTSVSVRSVSGTLRGMDLGQLTAQVERVSRQFGVERSSDWQILKLHEEVGELTQVHLMREGQARSKGLAALDLDQRFAAEIADVICHALLVANHHNVDVESAIEQKWLSRTQGRRSPSLPATGPPD